MRRGEPVVAERMDAGESQQVSWEEARQRFEDSQFYWLATASRDGWPHLMPVLGVWVGGALHFCTSDQTRKRRNLSRDPRCSVSIDSDDLHLILEGVAAPVGDDDHLRQIAVAYEEKYGWETTVSDGGLIGSGAPTAGPPPYLVYAVHPTTAFGFGTDESFGATRWRFCRRSRAT
jgi:general stress protein 26